MYIPPWLLALGLLILVCAMGATIVKSFRKFPEGFDDLAETGVKGDYLAPAQAPAEAPAEAPAIQQKQTQDAQEPIPMATAAYVSANSSEGPEFESYLNKSNLAYLVLLHKRTLI